MTAQIAETVLLEVRCPDCPGLGLQFTSRPLAEDAANDHDMEWHTPVLEDVAEVVS